MDDETFSAMKIWVVGTDVGMLAYWTLTVAKALGVVDIPGEWLYSNYDNELVVAWNWSFFPLDLLFSMCGLSAAWLHRRGHALWRPLAVTSLYLTWCAGFLALSYWAVRGEFDPLWWGINAFLMVWPMVFGWRIVGRSLGSRSPRVSRDP